MSYQIIICKCLSPNCSCIQQAKKHHGSKVIKNNKIIYPKTKSPVSYEKASQMKRRDFIFPTETVPSVLNFKMFDGCFINRESIEFDSPKNINELDKYLLEKYNMYHNQDSPNIWYVYLPNEIESFSLKPYGYLNPNAEPSHSLNSEFQDHKFSILVETTTKTNFSLEQSIREITQDEIRRHISN